MNHRVRLVTGALAGLALLSACTEGHSPIGSNEVDEALRAGDRVGLSHTDAAIMDDLSTFGLPGGTRLLVNGTGLLGETMGSISILTAPGVTPLGAYLYWGARTDAGDPSEVLVTFNGAGPTLLEGEYIGMSPIATGPDSHSFRLDLTVLAAVAVGANTVDIGVSLEQGIEGAALVIPYTDGTTGFVTVRDGNDWAYLPEPAQTELQEFSFAPDAQDRDATLHIIVGDADGNRPHRIDLEIEPGAPFSIYNPFGEGQSGRDGPEWDTWMMDLTIPAGGDAVRVQLFSDENTEDPASGAAASLYWVMAALEVLDPPPPPPPPPPPSGGEGCTPGYWKQKHHHDSWVGYGPDDLFDDVFDDAFDGMTLEDVLRQGGGGLKALGRHAVAALLNAASGGVDYDLTTDQVIDAFNDIHPGASKQEYNALKDVFAGFNEQGCPLN